jgi:hypothetical protein
MMLPPPLPTATGLETLLGFVVVLAAIAVTVTFTTLVVGFLGDRREREALVRIAVPPADPAAGAPAPPTRLSA